MFAICTSTAMPSVACRPNGAPPVSHSQSLRVQAANRPRPKLTAAARQWGGDADAASDLSAGASQSRAEPRCSTTDLGRRALLATLPGLGPLALAAATVIPPPAHAENGIVSFWRSRQRQNGGIKLIAPLRVAQTRLQRAATLLDVAKANPDGIPDVNAVKAVLQLVRESSLNCYQFEPLPSDSVETRASLLTQRLELSDPCTFRIILRTVTDFEAPEVRAQGKAMMDSLVLSYQKLDDLLDMAMEGSQDVLPRAADQLHATLVAVNDVEAFVGSLLGVPA